MYDEIKDEVVTNSEVLKIDQSEKIIKVYTEGKVYTCESVIVSVPPPLILKIKFIPKLPYHKFQLYTKSVYKIKIIK
jgi:monoamine oxidase